MAFFSPQNVATQLFFLWYQFCLDIILCPQPTEKCMLCRVFVFKSLKITPRMHIQLYTLFFNMGEGETKSNLYAKKK